jgi:hypothetical protein
MSLASSPATGVAGTKTVRTRRSNRHNGQPAAPMAPPSGLNYGKRVKGVEIDLAELFEPVMPPLPATLRSLFQNQETAGQAKLNPRDILDAPDTADFIFGAIAAGVAFNDIDKVLRVPTGTVNGWLVSDPQNLTRTSLSLVSAADLFDALARRLLAGLKGAPKATQLRVTLSAANSARCQAEGWRRLSESLNRKVTALADHKEVTKRETEVNRQLREREARAKADKDRRRKNHEQLVAEMGHAPGPELHLNIVAVSNLDPWTADEHQFAMPFEQFELEELHQQNRHAELQMYTGKIRDRWRAEHAAAAGKTETLPINAAPAKGATTKLEKRKDPKTPRPSAGNSR